LRLSCTFDLRWARKAQAWLAHSEGSLRSQKPTRHSTAAEMGASAPEHEASDKKVNGVRRNACAQGWPYLSLKLTVTEKRTVWTLPEASLYGSYFHCFTASVAALTSLGSAGPVAFSASV